jgi:hypothetical protein
MTMTIPAVFSNGVFTPTQPPALAEGTPVSLTYDVKAPPPADSPAKPPTDEELIARIKAAKTLQELFATREGLSTEDGDYDIERRLSENRKFSGDYRLFSEHHR